MAIESGMLEKINQRVYREYPEMHGSRPSISISGDRYTITYKGSVQTPAGKMSRVVRVVADGKGRVLKLSTSK